MEVGRCKESIDGCTSSCGSPQKHLRKVDDRWSGRASASNICISRRRCSRLNGPLSSTCTRSPLLFTLAAVFLAPSLTRVPVARAQTQGNETEGEALCACNPSIYSFTLDFSQECPPPGIDFGPETGINQWFCRTDGDDDSVTDLVPVSVSSYIILELDKGLQVIKQFFRGELDLQDGDTFEYTSIAASGDVGIDDIPGAMQMALVSAAPFFRFHARFLPSLSFQFETFICVLIRPY